MREGNGLFNDARNTLFFKIYGYMALAKGHSARMDEGNVLFNDALKTLTIFLRLYGGGIMVKGQSDNERGGEKCFI